MRSYRIILLFFIFTSFLSGQKYIDSWKNHPSIQNAHVAFQFSNIESGKDVLAFNQKKILNPASTIKLLSSLIFLEEVGENHQFETKIGYRGSITKDGTLDGDIIIWGNGDPSFASSRYGEKNSLNTLLLDVVSSIQKAGITCVEGNIIVDASFYGSDCTPPNWQLNDLGNYYAAGIWSVNANENAYKLSFDRSTPKIRNSAISPEIPKLYFTNELLRGSTNSGDQAYIYCAPYQDYAFIRGSIPKGKGSFSIRGSMPNAPLFLAHELQKYLDVNNIKSNGSEVSFSAIKMKKELWNHQGIEANKQVKSAIHKSINLYCESFLKHLGKGDRSQGIEYIEDYLKKNKIITNNKEVQITDGSGLSQRNFISTNIMTKFIRHQNKVNPNLKEYLARSGYHGTLKNAFKTKTLKGKIYGKSGSMGNIRAYNGILLTNSGKELAFSIMVNNYTATSSDVYLHIQNLLEYVVKEK